MNPVLKYSGGKSREIPLFEKYIPRNYECYYEPFLGGGALFFHLEPETAVINDLNNNLMTFYKQLKNNYKKLTEQLDQLQGIYEKNQEQYKKLKLLDPEQHIKNGNEELYYKMRKMYNKLIPSEYLEGVIYFFINKTAYSGMTRYNSSGEYNVPFGRYPNLNTKLITKEHNQLLKKTKLLNTDYKKLFDMATENDFMFLDPPYDCIFNDYGNIDMMNGFDEIEHERLAKEFQNLKCKALMIIGKTPLTEKLYKKYIRDEYYKNYSVNIKNRFKADSKHLIITNYED